MNIKLLLITGLAFGAGLIGFSLFSFDSGAAHSTLTLQSECNLSSDEVCVAQDQTGHRVSISLSPRPVPILKDVQVTAAVMGFEAIRTARISIEGLNMYMGIQIIPLQIAQNKDADIQLTGSLQLPICTSQMMEWQATLILQTENREYRAAFPFTTTSP